MNFALVSALVIRLFSAYELFYVCDDAFYLLGKQATDPHYSGYQFILFMMIFRTCLALVMFIQAIPLGRRISKGLSELTNKTEA
jgi:hypothetical protein